MIRPEECDGRRAAAACEKVIDLLLDAAKDNQGRVMLTVKHASLPAYSPAAGSILKGWYEANGWNFVNYADNLNINNVQIDWEKFEERRQLNRLPCDRDDPPAAPGKGLAIVASAFVAICALVVWFAYACLNP